MKAARLPRKALELPVAQEMLRASMILRAGEAVGIRMGSLVIQHPHPVYALCRQLLASGWPDSMLHVSDPGGRTSCIVESIHSLANWPTRDLAAHWPPMVVKPL